MKSFFESVQNLLSENQELDSNSINQKIEVIELIKDNI